MPLRGILFIMSRQAIFAEQILMSRDLLKRYLAGFDDATHTAQGPSMPNHAAWNLGHLALTLHRVAERIDGLSVPDSAFATEGKGDAEHFGIETIAFGSTPTPEPDRYPSWGRCVQIFDEAAERLANAVRTASDATLEKPTAWGGRDVPLWTLLPRMVFHNGMHCGQIADIRRALGFTSIFS
jgi:hypothetical protein